MLPRYYTMQSTNAKRKKKKEQGRIIRESNKDIKLILHDYCSRNGATNIDFKVQKASGGRIPVKTTDNSPSKYHFVRCY